MSGPANLAGLVNSAGQFIPPKMGEIAATAAATLDLGAIPSLCVLVSGTTGITSFGTTPDVVRFLRFSSATTLTHSSSLALPGAANITTAAGDTCIVRSDASGNFRVSHYQRAAIAPLNVALGTAAALNTGTSGATIPRLDGVNTFENTQTIGSGIGLRQLVANGGIGANAGAGLQLTDGTTTHFIAHSQGIGLNSLRSLAIYAGNSKDIEFWTAGTKYAKIDGSTGALSVLSTTASTSSTTGALTVAGGLGVAGAGYFGNTLSASFSGGSGGNLVVSNLGTSSPVCQRSTLPNVVGSTNQNFFLIGTDSAGDKVQIHGNGNIYNSNNVFAALSDRDAKRGIIDARSMLDDFMSIRFRQFRLNEDGDDEPLRLGVISQEVELVGFANLVDQVSTAVGSDIKIRKNFNYAGLSVVTGRVLQEALHYIHALESRIARLESLAS